MPDATDRPQDAGRSHRRRPRLSAASASLLARYHDALREDLDTVLDELRGTVAPTGLLDAQLAPGEVRTRPPVKERAALWDLAIKLARELGTAIEPGPEPKGGAQPARRSRRKVAYD